MTNKNVQRILPIIGLVLLLGCSPILKVTAFPVPEQSTINAETRLAAPPVGVETQSFPVAETPTIEATQTGTSTPIAVTINPTYLKFLTVTPTATIDLDQFLLKIVSPGPMSKVVSPIEFIVQIAPGFTGTTRIELIGEDGVELYRKVYKTYSNIGYYTRVDEHINFEIQGTAEVARLQISTFDLSGRIQAVNSVRLLLQTIGDNQIAPANEIRDRLFLHFPGVDEEIAGNSVSVKGEFLPVNDQPIVIELIDENGGVIGSRIVQLNSSAGGYQPFATNIPFQTAKKTQVRLVIRQSDDRIGGVAYLFSRLVVLSPK